MTDQPWWINKANQVSVLDVNNARTQILYAHSLGIVWEYALVEWRAGSAYMMGLYRNGSDVTPVDSRVIEFNEMKKNGW